MPPRHDYAPWNNEVELADAKHCTTVLGMSGEATAHFLNEKHHKGRPVRSRGAVNMLRTKRGWKVAKVPKPFKDVGPTKQQEVEREETPDGITLKSRGSRITTVAELLAHGGVDATKWDIATQTVKTWDTTLIEAGEAKTVQNFAIHVTVKPKAGPSVTEAVEAIIAGAFAGRKPLPKSDKVGKAGKGPSSGLMQAVVIADPHIGKLAYAKETGHGNYDLDIATTLLRDANANLIAWGNSEKPEVRHIFMLGDVFQYDTPSGTTTKGTPQDRDGRIQKMIEEGSKAIFDVIEWSAETCPTVVTAVVGNHDFSLGWALQRILVSHFRHDTRVTVDNGFSSRKYVRFGKCLFGLTHGDKGRKLLPGLMAREAAYEWGQTTLREIHHGHLHFKKATDTIEGVTVRQHPALCPPDAYHSSEGYVSDRGQESWLYHKAGAVVGSRCYSPDLNAPIARGVR